MTSAWTPESRREILVFFRVAWLYSMPAFFCEPRPQGTAQAGSPFPRVSLSQLCPWNYGTIAYSLSHVCCGHPISSMSPSWMFTSRLQASACTP